MAWYNLDLTALRETRSSDQGQLEEVGAPERSDTGVALDIQTDIVGHLPYLPQGINVRLMSLWLQNWRQIATIVSVFSSPLTNFIEVKKNFYEYLTALLATVLRRISLFALVILKPSSAQTMPREGEGWVSMVPAAGTIMMTIFCETVLKTVSC
ncbi:unnamed protein product [Schistocephalus solidus]|uniref:Uncharacterized protein n=1 Tax=Schistocephalus solidus TaxID=70667 RepID=A0A183TJE6_SCHSO|nr:unnamed protein product [Schistocephalus solidus]